MNIRKFLSNKSILCIIAGILFGLSFPPIDLHFLVFFAFAIYIYIVTSSTTYKKVIFRSYLIFVVWELIAISWIGLSGFSKPEYFMVIGGLLTALLHPIVYLLPPTIIFFFAARNIKFKKYPELILIVLPPIWIAFEYLQTINELTFPWLSLAYTQTYNLSKVQYIDITGMYAITLWITIISILLFIGFRRITFKKWELKSKNSIALLVLILVIYFAPDLYNMITSAKSEYTNNFSDGKIDVAIVQPNKDPWKKWGTDQIAITEEYTDLMQEAADGNPKPQLIILPETSLPYVLRMPMNAPKHGIIKSFVERTNIPVLIGAPDMIYYSDSDNVPVDAREFSDGDKYDVFNTAILIEKDVKIDNYQTHDKFKLVIGSERMPYQDRLIFLRDMIKFTVGLSNFQIGKDTVLFDLDGKYKFNTAICYESVFPEFFANYVDMGADFSVIITNDGWWGKMFGTYQHNQYATFRAIENRRWIARSANTGISCTIDPYGNMYDATEINERTIINSTIGIRKDKTFYTKNGDILSKLMIIITIVTLLSTIIRKIGRKN